MNNEEINAQLGYGRPDDEPFVVYDVLSPEYPAPLLCSLEMDPKDFGHQRVFGSLIVVTAGVRRSVNKESYIFLGGLLGPGETGRPFAVRSVDAFTHPDSSVFVLYERLGSSPNQVADTAKRNGFRVFEIGRYLANKDIICIGSSEMLSGLNWLEDAWPTTGSFVVACKAPSRFLDDLERSALESANPYDVLTDFKKQTCLNAKLASERLGICEALAYFDGPDGESLVIHTSVKQLGSIHAAFRDIANDLGTSLYFAGSPSKYNVFDGFEGWLSWRQMPESWKRIS